MFVEPSSPQQGGELNRRFQRGGRSGEHYFIARWVAGLVANAHDQYSS